MANVRAKVFEYATQLDPGKVLRAEGADPLATGATWTPENILLGALLRCITSSLEHYAGPAGLTVAVTGEARGTVTLREDEGVFGLVSAEADVDITLDPLPEPEALLKLLRRAKAGCFVSNSLSVKPAFHFTVNGAPVEIA
jgi:organic hydroperoxide reductase OsmC/OhrA